MDTRTWVEAGTVGYYDEAGTFQTSPLVQPPGGGPRVPSAVYVDIHGAVVDVRLEGGGEVVTCHWAGIGVGVFGSMLFPLRGGEDVLVALPGGDPNSADCTIIAVKANAERPIPNDWNNDRVLFDLNVPIEIRGPAIKLESGNLTINGRAVRRGGRGI